MSTRDLQNSIHHRFERDGVAVQGIEVRHFPNETNVLVFVGEGHYGRAIEAAEAVEAEVQFQSDHPILVVVRRVREELASEDDPVAGVQSPRAATLLRLLQARSRVSEGQPSLAYVKDLSENIATVTAARHHLVFGRRGAGKSTLLVEARRDITDEGHLSAWTNLQILRRDIVPRIFLRIVREMISSVATELIREGSSSEVVPEVTQLLERLEETINIAGLTPADAERVIPDVQRSLKRSLDYLDLDLYVFVDDFYYVPRRDQPAVLDMLHGCVRDSRCWLKIASIRHLTRWFSTHPPMGLQTGHDADVIDLDITLEEPKLVRQFLIQILTNYCSEAGIGNINTMFRRPALDRLVLASGGVPRDFLVLASSAITKARTRPNARLVGVQEVNQVAGERASEKIQELEEDLASTEGEAARNLEALAIMRAFCLTERSSTYYRIDYFDKEQRAAEYQVITDLLDLRLLHLIHSSVSDGHEAGRRYEVFMLDLSQFSGSRLKQGIKVLDLQGDILVARTTRGGSEAVRRAATPNQLLAVMRPAPLFELERLSPLVASEIQVGANSGDPGRLRLR